MTVVLHDELARSWAREPALRRDAFRWTWFRPAFAAVLAQQAPVGLPAPNEEALAAAFLAWARAAEACDAYAEVDPLDHLQFVAGMLLQHLLAVRPAVFGELRSPAAESADRPGGSGSPGSREWPQGQALTAFVLTLLQAWRLQAGAAALDLPPPEARTWRSLRENAAEDAASAIAWLDQLCGLQPVWEAPTLVGSRPAMLRARASER